MSSFLISAVSAADKLSLACRADMVADASQSDSRSWIDVLCFSVSRHGEWTDKSSAKELLEEDGLLKSSTAMPVRIPRNIIPVTRAGFVRFFMYENVWYGE